LSKTIDQLRGEIEELRRELAYHEELDAERQATIATLQEQLEAVQEQNALLQKALFAPRRERFIPSPDQKLLFEPLLVDGDEANSSARPLEQAEAVPAAPRRKRRPRRSRFEFPQCLPIRRFEYPLDEEDRLCPCGCGLRGVINELITRQLRGLDSPTEDTGDYCRARAKLSPASGPSRIATATARFRRW
jgi:hypothetical protein